MSLVEMLLLGLALSMDAFAVTISNTFAYPDEPRAKLLLMPIFFGLFQGLMPVAGYFLGSFAAVYIERYAGIVTLVILGFIGFTMIKEGVEALRGKGEDGADGEGASSEDPAESPATSGSVTPAKRLGIKTLLVQAVATSIDAFAVGVSLLAEGANIAVAGSVIAATTFACCVVALFLGKRFGTLLGEKAQIVGGCILVGIGIKAMFF